MSKLVYAFPPIWVQGHEWTVHQPINVSVGIWDQRQHTSGGFRSRRVVELSTISIADDGGGYVEVLKELLEGREHLVRLYSYSPNHFGEEATDAERQSWPLAWRTDADNPLAWRTEFGQPMRWFTGASGAVGGQTIMAELLSPSQGMGRILVSGLPPNRLVIRVGEFVEMYPDGDFSAGVRLRSVRRAITNAQGEATIWTVRPFAFAGHCNLGVRDTGVFSVDEMPRAMRTPGQDWPYAWNFTEVFEDETPGGFVERDPW